MPEKWDCHRMDYNSHNGQYLHSHHHYHSRNQSFSSALLDAICKSTEVEGGMMAYKKSSNQQEMRHVEGMKNTVMRNSIIQRQRDEDSGKDNEKLMRGRVAKMGIFNAEKTEAGAAYSKHRESHPSFQSAYISSAALYSSDYASSTSTISCPYLSSDAKSVYTHTSSIRTAKTERNSHHVGCDDRTCKWVVGGECSRDLHGDSLVRDGSFRYTEKHFNPSDHHAKIKSMSKTGNYSKKPSQPISPGRKLVNFLNSLFMAGGTKKPKLSSSSSVSDSNSCDSSGRKPASVYSSSSSVQSRPCLTKSSRGSNNTSGMSQKSVAFFPTSVFVGKTDSRPCGQKCLQNQKDNHAAAKNIIGKQLAANGIMDAVVRTLDKQDEEEEEEDFASCSSSDLFELENLAGIDVNRYQKELPVYGTTHWETNKAIAKGLIVS